ncbi:CRISPR-associated helicase/endonuclease Cas3, partial [Candidatus Methanarcanum hacksteinii]|uniref:CRISPR-associated helicase/endonuclease Cas3 n=1 Tax=Candidatus Methanarcanum hacksteinii TaxID=2911857 RepID=UPI0037DD4B72
MDSWDAPIIFTSMVQFLEALFSSGTRRVRRMHNLVNSVIVFDEIQSLPMKTTFMFNEAISFLTRYCGSTAVLCTATQPTLGGDLDYPLGLNKGSEIIENPFRLYESLKRTRVHYLNKGGVPADHDDVARVALEFIKEHGSVLVIVNTKTMAKSVYEDIRSQSSEDVSVYHLSTNMCPVHRRKVLANVLDVVGKRKTICVSTQLIEAGVDVDFELVVRSLAGLDSIAQA